MNFRLLILCVLLSATPVFSGEKQFGLVGDRAASIEVMQLHSTERVQIPFEGKTVVVDFFSTYCPPCRGIYPHVGALAKKYQANKSVIFLAIGLGRGTDEERRKAVSRFVNELGLSVPTYLDPKTIAIADEYGVDRIPMTFVIQDGVIRFRGLGYKPIKDGLETAIRSAIGN